MYFYRRAVYGYSDLGGKVMKQPKFKFGDVVQTSTKKIIEIRKIEYSAEDGMYVYSDANWASFESELELYQEPQKKKLYAYVCEANIHPENCVEIRHFTGELPQSWHAFTRKSEYDIEYPDYQTQNYQPNGLQDINTRARG